MKRRFFIRRFLRYLMLLMVPTILIFSFAMISFNYQLDRSLDARAKNTLSSVNNSLEMMVSNVAYQNEQLTNNAYTLIALKRLMQRETRIPYSDAIYLRNIKSTLSSIIRAYPYIQSVYLYLDGYNNYFSSDYGLEQLQPKGKNNWYSSYRSMSSDEESLMETRAAADTGYGRSMITIYQKMKLQKGVVVMNIDVGAYLASLDAILQKDNETVLYLDKKDQLILAWNDENGAADSFSGTKFKNSGQENSWKKINGKSYLVHTAVNDQYDLLLVSLISRQAKMNNIIQVAGAFLAVFVLNIIAMMALAYTTTVRTFRQIEYMIQVFYDAESGVYPSGPRQEVKDEYDILMNNIIYLFLNTVKLQTELTEKRHNQEVAELTALQLQINPHFLYNTLDMINWLSQSGQSEKVTEAVQALTRFYRLTLGSKDLISTVQDEVTHVSLYMQLQNMRYNNCAEFIADVPPELDHFSIPRLTFQPIVENALLHGIMMKEEKKGTILLTGWREENDIVFVISDDGAGIPPEKLDSLLDERTQAAVGSSSRHVGVSNTNLRLKSLYGSGYGLSFTSVPGQGTEVTVRIPAQEEEEF